MRASLFLVAALVACAAAVQLAAITTKYSQGTCTAPGATALSIDVSAANYCNNRSDSVNTLFQKTTCTPGATDGGVMVQSYTDAACTVPSGTPFARTCSTTYTRLPSVYTCVDLATYTQTTATGYLMARYYPTTDCTGTSFEMAFYLRDACANAAQPGNGVEFEVWRTISTTQVGIWQNCESSCDYDSCEYATNYTVGVCMQNNPGSMIFTLDPVAPTSFTFSTGASVDLTSTGAGETSTTTAGNATTTGAGAVNAPVAFVSTLALALLAVLAL